MDKLGNFLLGLVIFLVLVWVAHGIGYLLSKHRGQYMRKPNGAFVISNKGAAFFALMFVAWAWVYGAVIIFHDTGAWVTKLVHGLF